MMRKLALSSAVTEKRGRGRPRKAGAMSNAQRQAAFRARRKASRDSVTVTEIVSPVVDGYDELVVENDRLREELARVSRELSEQQRAFLSAVSKPVGRKWAYRPLTALAEFEIRRALEEAQAEGRNSAAGLWQTGYAFGVRSFWHALTCGWQDRGDYERLDALAHGVD